MAYNSYFDKILKEDPFFRKGFKQQYYRGCLENILDELQKDVLNVDDFYSMVRLVLHPARIIRGVIDYKLSFPYAQSLDVLMQSALDLSLEIYSLGQNLPLKINEFKGKINDTGNYLLLENEICQNVDGITWKASNPVKTKKTVEELIGKTNKSPVLFVALGHGGVASGMDTYLRYCDMCKDNDSAFYVVRFSTRKMKDKIPCVDSYDINYLKQNIENRITVVFDEDKSTGNTLNSAVSFLRDNIFCGIEPIGLINLDSSDELQNQTGNDMIMLKSNLCFGKKNINVKIVNEYGVIRYQRDFEEIDDLDDLEKYCI